MRATLKRLLTLALAFGLAPSAFSQTHPAVFRATLGAGPASTFPDCGSTRRGAVRRITDGLTGEDCGTGGGTDIHWCECDGSDWIAAAGATADPLTVLGPASVCQAHPFSPNEDGEAYLPVPLLLTETSLMCSLLYMYVEPNQSWAELTSLPGNSLRFFATDAVEGPGLPTPGGKVSISAGNAAGSTDTDGAARGGDLELYAGGSARLNSGDENGGDISLVPGAGVGTGRSGNVVIATGNLTGPSGGFTIIGGTGATDDLILDGSAGTAGSVTITEAGYLRVPNGTSSAASIGTADTNGMFFGAANTAVDFLANNVFVARLNSAGLVLGNSTSSPSISFANANADSANTVSIAREAAGTLALGSTNQQMAFRVYNLGAGLGSTNYERLTLTGVAGASVDIKAETAGSGADSLALNLSGEGPTGTVVLDGSDDVAGSVTVTAAGAMKGPKGGFIVESSDGDWSFRNSGDGASTVIAQDVLLGAGYDAAVGGSYGGVKLASGKLLNWSSTTDALSGASDTGLARSAAGVVKVTDGSTGIGKLLYAKAVTPDIDGETTTAVQSGTLWTNTGDGDGEAITLLNDPGIGVQYCFGVDVAQTITVAPSTGETLYYGTDNCVASLTSNAIGSTLCVVAVTGGTGAKWFTLSSTGTWTCND